MKNKIKKVNNLIKQFGIIFLIKYIFYRITKDDKAYIDLCYKYLLNEIRPVIEKYKDEKIQTIENIGGKIPVWVCWWQGYDNMPNICKMLYNRLKKMLPENAILTLITLDNYLDYTNIPPKIVEKFNSGKINMTTYSDILRNSLIKEHGGMWIDSTIYCAKKIKKEFLIESKWWSVNLYNDNAKIENLGQKITERKWSGFIQKGNKGNLLNNFVYDAFLLYYEKNDILIDYFIQNLIIKIAYNELPNIKKMIDENPINNINVYDLYNHIDEEYNPDKYNEWIKNTTFFKLTYKRQYNERNNERKINYYGKIKNICEMGEKNFNE